MKPPAVPGESRGSKTRRDGGSALHAAVNETSTAHEFILRFPSGVVKRNLRNPAGSCAYPPGDAKSPAERF